MIEFEKRPYEQTDKVDLLGIFRLNIPAFFDITEELDYARYLEQYGKHYVTVLVDHQIVGGAGYFVNEIDNSGRISWIFFDPKYAGQGLGSQMVYHCLSILKMDLRVKKLIVETSQHAFQFFQKFGYKTIRIEKNYWGDDLDLYEMEKPNQYSE